MSEPTQPEIDPTALIEELRAALRARDEFILVAAHELRNPMTPIVGQIDLLLRAAHRDGAPPSIMTGLERLQAAISHYVRRATTLLEISRLNAGGAPLEPVSFNLSQLVSETVAIYAVVSRRVRCRLDSFIQPDVVGTWDRLAVEQVLDNLLSNAFKFCDGKPVEVTLSATGTGATLTVRDHGVGIAESDQARIFDRFGQGEGQRGHGGFGVGLWLARQLVTAMDGTITLASRPGEGATFTVRLPLHAGGGTARGIG